MMGHPGISVMEYAGGGEGDLEKNEEKKTDERSGWKRLKKRWPSSTAPLQHGSAPAAKTLNDSASASMAPESEPKSGRNVEVGSIQQQRRRGNFIDHTPRDYEARISKRTEAQSSVDSYSRLQTSYQGSSDEITRPSTQHDQTSSYGSFNVEPIHHGTPSWTSGEHESREVIAPRSDRLKVRRGMETSSTEVNPGAQEQGPAAASPEENLGRHEHQTASHSPTPLPARLTQHIPLEPLVAKYRNEQHSSNISDTPPRLEIDRIAQLSRDMAFKEYYQHQDQESQESKFSSVQKEEVRDDSVPELPHRNPQRLHETNTHFRAKSNLSMTSDFASAANGQYSPYDTKYSLPLKASSRPKPGPDDNQPPKHGLLAPPIASHDQLTASTGLSDLCDFLKNSGPSPSPPKKKSGAGRIFRGRRKPSVSVAHLDSVRPLKPVLPACVCETVTLGGARHCQIVLPEEAKPGRAGGGELARLQRQNVELTAALARALGLDEEMGAEEVLEVYRELQQ